MWKPTEPSNAYQAKDLQADWPRGGMLAGNSSTLFDVQVQCSSISGTFSSASHL